MTSLRGLLCLGIAAALTAPPAGAEEPGAPSRAVDRPARRALPEDDGTFRPTVLVRKGLSQGTGTVIASVEGETLILTAAHVLKEPGALVVEFHRYNLGLERAAVRGTWPKRVGGEIAAADRVADVAVVRVRKLPALPYVARLAPGDQNPERGAVVLSVGIDQGTHLNSWQSRVRGTAWLSLQKGQDERPFVITVEAPQRGRSGGGLFLDGGALAGVCTGRAEMVEGQVCGVFASPASVRRLLRESDLDEAVRRSALARRADHPRLTPTQARSAGPPGPAR